jgi:ubiquitin carboxyl-terminal hydrolase 4/11/15
VYLPAELQNLFELSYVSEPGSLLTTGANSVSDDKEFPKLSSRVPEPASDDALDNATNGTASNEETSSDELSRGDTESPVTRMSVESDDESKVKVNLKNHRQVDIRRLLALQSGLLTKP